MQQEIPLLKKMIREFGTMRARMENDTYELSRRSLLQGAAYGIGAATVVAMTMTAARAGKMPQAAVGYKPSPNGNQNCGNCRLFQAPNACATVDGDISPSGWCKIWVPK